MVISVSGPDLRIPDDRFHQTGDRPVPNEIEVEPADLGGEAHPMSEVGSRIGGI
jgi:hypothetical protein